MKDKNSVLKDLAHDRMVDLREKRKELNDIIKEND